MIKKCSPTNNIFKKRHAFNHRPKIPFTKTDKKQYFTEKMKNHQIEIESFEFDNRQTYYTNKNAEFISGNSYREELKTEVLLTKDIQKSVINII